MRRDINHYKRWPLWVKIGLWFALIDVVLLAFAFWLFRFYDPFVAEVPFWWEFIVGLIFLINQLALNLHLHPLFTLISAGFIYFSFGVLVGFIIQKFKNRKAV